MRTLSARILLGFAALTITFGVITATLVVNMRQVEDQVLLIGKGYVPLALESKDLARRQDELHTYVENRVQEESSERVKGELSRLRGNRDQRVREIRKIMVRLETVIDVDPRQFAITRPRLEQIEKSVAAVDALYTELLNGPGTTAAHAEVLGKLRGEERKLWDLINKLSDQLERSVGLTTSYLEHNEHTLRARTIYFGLTAVVLGLLVTVWVVITLRPLRRLRDGARRIAAGDYASRISEKGPAEVRDLAREFNSMGRAVEERERELVRSERLAAVGKMAAMITHEVRNPLSSIGLNTELLEDELPSGDDAVEARNLCRAIHREVDRLTAITEEYLAFARLPKPKLAREPINAIVGALAAFVREDLAARKVTLTTELAGGDPVAQIDGAQIRQCLINLVRNAADAVVAKGEGHVTLRTRVVRPGRIEIDVQDDGIGIAPDMIPKLFDPFFSTKEGGNGLGLALTQQIIRDHGGDLRVDSVVGKGTTFTVSVPAS
ncbi:MAG TPA: ATP-binding protein [Kofleriaceae bacterium]|nr:ATP-binding protein [Kofleriaceae bacterium]